MPSKKRDFFQTKGSDPTWTEPQKKLLLTSAIQEHTAQIKQGENSLEGKLLFDEKGLKIQLHYYHSKKLTGMKSSKSNKD